MIRKDWTWTAPDGSELRLMQLPDRQNLQLVLLNDDDGMQQVARTHSDRAAAKLAAWLDAMLGSAST